MLKPIRASHPSSLSDGHVSSGLGVETGMTVNVWTIFPSLKAIVGPRDRPQTDSAFDFLFQMPAIYWHAASIVLFQDTDMPC